MPQRPVRSKNQGKEVMAVENEMLKLLKTRRSVRSYLDKKVEEEKLNAVLEAGTWAPTGMGMQSPVIVAVENPQDRQAVQELNCLARGGHADPYYGAPLILLVLADPARGTCVEDGACVLNTMMLAAHSLGLSSCWIHGEKEMFQLPQGKALLKKWGLPENLRGVGSLALGYGSGPQPQPKERKAGYIVKV